MDLIHRACCAGQRDNLVVAAKMLVGGYRRSLSRTESSSSPTIEVISMSPTGEPETSECESSPDAGKVVSCLLNGPEVFLSKTCSESPQFKLVRMLQKYDVMCFLEVTFFFVFFLCDSSSLCGSRWFSLCDSSFFLVFPLSDSSYLV